MNRRGRANARGGEDGQGHYQPAVWRAQFDAALDTEWGVDAYRLKELRSDVQTGTIAAVMAGQYPVGDTMVTLPQEEMNKGIQGTHAFGEPPGDPAAEGGRWPVLGTFGGTHIEVKNQDCLLVAGDLYERDPGSHIGVLNMANGRRPGGGWLSGCGAHEENLHRRTNLCEHLHEGFRRADVEGPVHPLQYPLPEFGGVFSPSVVVFRGAEACGYPFLPEPFPISVLSVAAHYHCIFLISTIKS